MRQRASPCLQPCAQAADRRIANPPQVNNPRLRVRARMPQKPGSHCVSPNSDTHLGIGIYLPMRAASARKGCESNSVTRRCLNARNLTSLTDIAEPIGTVVNNRGYDWGNSNIGFKHRFSIRLTYELPFGKSATGFTKAVLGGWQVNAISFWQSGTLFDIAAGAEFDRTDSVHATWN